MPVQKAGRSSFAEYDEFRRKTTSDVIRRRLQPERLRPSEDRMQAAHVHSTAASVVRTGDSPGGVKTARMKLMQTEQPKSPNHVPIDGGSLKRELARVAVQQRHEAESRAAAERTQQWETVARLTRESQTPPVTASTAHVDQTPRPMAPYGYWASPSGHRYGGR